MKAGDMVWVELLPWEREADRWRRGVISFVRADGRIEVTLSLPLGSSITIPFDAAQVRPRPEA